MSSRNHQFYLTLPSNSSMKYFPDNTVACYTTRLPHHIQLESGDEWEVALVEIHYPYSFVSTSEPLRVGFDFRNGFTNVSGHRTITIKSIKYKNVGELLNEINSDANLSDYVEFDYDYSLNRVRVKTSNLTRLTLSRALALQLGIEEDTLISSNGQEITGLWSPNLAAGLSPYMYVYCDLVEAQFIGDTTAPLLKIVNMNINKYAYGSYNSVSYTSPHYVPVMKSRFETIEINLKDDFGGKLPFVFGASCVKLHFRRAQQQQ